MKHDVTVDLLDEMATCIYLCNWSSEDEILAYMKGCIIEGCEYDAEKWSEDEVINE